MMNRRKIVLLSLLGAAFAISRIRAADASARTFVAAIYNAYKGKNGNGISLNSDATIRRYFEPGLAGLIIKDRKDAADRGEAPTLSSDPFVGSSENPKLGVVVGMLMGGKGVAKRRRENFEFTSLKLTPHTLIKEVKRQWLWQQQNRVGGIFTSFATPATRRF